MHRALYISEVLAEIIHYLKGDYLENGASDLATLAVTCKAFSLPALSVLWNESHFFPVVSLLGDALGIVVEAEDEDEDRGQPPTRATIVSLLPAQSGIKPR